jgi:hypothetical protein
MTPEYERLYVLITGTPGAATVLRDAHQLAQTGYHSAAQLLVAGVADTIAEAHPDQVPEADALTLNRVLARLFLE